MYFTSTAGDDPIPRAASFTTVSRNGNEGVGTVIADVIQVQWQKKDKSIISLLASQSAAGTGGAQAGASATAPAASSTSISRHKKDSGGMSTGAKIGIGIAVPIILLSVLAIGAILFLRTRKRRATQKEKPEPSVETENFHELPPDEAKNKLSLDDRMREEQTKVGYQPPVEMDAQDYTELPADGPVQELGGQPMQRGSVFKSESLRSTQSPTMPRTPKKGFLR